MNSATALLSVSTDLRVMSPAGTPDCPTPLYGSLKEKWIEAMNRLDIFRNKLKAIESGEVAKVAYDLSLLEKARKRLEQKRKE